MMAPSWSRASSSSPRSGTHEKACPVVAAPLPLLAVDVRGHRRRLPLGAAGRRVPGRLESDSLLPRAGGVGLFVAFMAAGVSSVRYLAGAREARHDRSAAAAVEI